MREAPAGLILSQLRSSKKHVCLNDLGGLFWEVFGKSGGSSRKVYGSSWGLLGGTLADLFEGKAYQPNLIYNSHLKHSVFYKWQVCKCCLCFLICLSTSTNRPWNYLKIIQNPTKQTPRHFPNTSPTNPNIPPNLPTTSRKHPRKKRSLFGGKLYQHNLI